MAKSKSDEAAKQPEQKPERDTKTKILDWLDGHGFPLEMRTAKALHLAQYRVAQSLYFENAQGVQQEIDIVAMKSAAWSDPKPGGFVDMSIVAECKANPKSQLPWVVFTADTHAATHKLVGSYSLLSEVASMAYEQVEDRNEIAKPALLTFGDRIGYGIQCAQVHEGKTNDDFAYHAILKLTHAALSRLPTTKTARIVLPVLVVNTPLYECWLDDAGIIQLEERNHLVLGWHRPTLVKSKRSYMAVHVVRESGILEFIKKSDELFSFFADTLRDEVTSSVTLYEMHLQQEADRKKREKQLMTFLDPSKLTLGPPR